MVIARLEVEPAMRSSMERIYMLKFLFVGVDMQFQLLYKRKALFRRLM